MTSHVSTAMQTTRSADASIRHVHAIPKQTYDTKISATLQRA
jgi:homoserine trans-succinylase